MSFAVASIARSYGDRVRCLVADPVSLRVPREACANVTGSRLRSDTVGLASALFGQAILPAFYVATGIPGAADHPASAWAVALGTTIFCSALWIFRISHRELCRNWSIALEIRERHELVCAGPYALVRHAMYASFLLMRLGQVFLNWVAGISGLIGLAVLFLLKVDKEERMMVENFGSQYRAYME